MKKIHAYTTGLLAVIALVTLVAISSCKKYNDWPVDDSYNRLFSPLGFTASAEVIKVTLKWKNMPSTHGYTIELSEDSLAFTTIIKTYSGGASKDADGYVFVIPDLLKSNTRYSARIKGTDSIGIPESRWSVVTFKTGTEQIMQPIAAADVTITSVKLSWTIPNEVTHFMIGAVKYDISSGEKAAGTKTITGLTGGTQYTAELYYNNIIRGKQAFKTYAPNPSGANVVKLMAAGDFTTLLPTAVAGTTFIIPQGAVYSYDDLITLPAGASLTFWGEDGPSKPVLALNGLTLPATAGSIKFANIDLTGYQQNNPALTKRNYIFNQSTASNTTENIFDNSIVRNFVNTPVRLQGSNAITIGKLAFNNCIIYDCGDNASTGTYALVHNSVATGKINNIEFTNSTVYKIGYSVILHNLAPSQSVLIDNCTFNDVAGNTRYFIDYNAQAITSFTVRNTIIGKTLSSAGTARGIRAATIPVVTNSYKTTDAVFAGNAIPDIMDYGKDNTSLFTAPVTGNFLIKDNTFAGKATAGDPRWRP
jgi:hypothetical protein